jgi:predicted RNA-binding Zn-ribbon protein involved in translation (DUF1610 family)
MSNQSALSKNFAVISLGLLTTISTGIILGQLQAKASFLIYAVLQITGFIGGGVMLFWLLKDAIYCDECSIDLKRRTVQERYTSEPLRTLRQKLRVFKNKLTTEPPIAAISYHAKEMGTTKAVDTHLRTRVIVHKCARCGVSHLQCDTERSISNKYWSGLPLTRIIHWYQPENRHSDLDRSK